MIAVIMGHIGSGKTTLFNKLCRTNYPSGRSKNSKTRDIVMHDIAYGDHKI